MSPQGKPKSTAEVYFGVEDDRLDALEQTAALMEAVSSQGPPQGQSGQPTGRPADRRPAQGQTADAQTYRQTRRPPISADRQTGRPAQGQTGRPADRQTPLQGPMSLEDPKTFIRARKLTPDLSIIQSRMFIALAAHTNNLTTYANLKAILNERIATTTLRHRIAALCAKKYLYATGKFLSRNPLLQGLAFRFSDKGIRVHAQLIDMDPSLPAFMATQTSVLPNIDAQCWPVLQKEDSCLLKGTLIFDQGIWSYTDQGPGFRASNMRQTGRPADTQTGRPAEGLPPPPSSSSKKILKKTTTTAVIIPFESDETLTPSPTDSGSARWNSDPELGVWRELGLGYSQVSGWAQEFGVDEATIFRGCRRQAFALQKRSKKPPDDAVSWLYGALKRSGGIIAEPSGYMSFEENKLKEARTALEKQRKILEEMQQVRAERERVEALLEFESLIEKSSDYPWGNALDGIYEAQPFLRNCKGPQLRRHMQRLFLGEQTAGDEF